jgi:hypothetical protein
MDNCYHDGESERRIPAGERGALCKLALRCVWLPACVSAWAQPLCYERRWGFSSRRGRRITVCGVVQSCCCALSARSGAAMGLVNILGIVMILAAPPIIGHMVDWSGTFHSSFLALGVFTLAALLATSGIHKELANER